jgi:DNA adenine methylase
MKPFFKYTGGKTRELKNIRPYIPAAAQRIIEPFCGSCAVAFDAGKSAIVGDLDDDVINLLQVTRNPKQFRALMKLISGTNPPEGTADTAKFLETVYYRQRDGKFGTVDPVEKAYRFLVLRQLCFSGMTRFNAKTGKSNVPFGWYPIFKTRLDETYHLLLQDWDIALRPWGVTSGLATPADWVFFDPPYLERNSSYEVDSDAGTSTVLHAAMKLECDRLTSAGIPWLIVHSDCEFYRDAYQDCDITVFDIHYSQNFKGAGIKNARPGHLYICPKGTTPSPAQKVIVPREIKPKLVTRAPAQKRETGIQVSKAEMVPKLHNGAKQGGWQVKAEWYGKGIRIKCARPFDGSYWECDHDVLVDVINAALRAKNKPILGEPGPACRAYGSGTGLREQHLWTRAS